MHIPVLKKEVIDLLKVEADNNYIDCTAGLGGHLKEILAHNGEGEVLAFEWDTELYEKLQDKTLKRATIVNQSYVFLQKTVEELDFGPVSGVLFDLGLSMWHIKESQKGFTFQEDEPLDMRYNKDSLLTAKEIVNEWSQRDIQKIIKDYSNEKFASQIAEEIIASRPLKTTQELVKVVKKVVPNDYENGRIHPATRTFQALRIAVNAELYNLQEALPQAYKTIKVGGRLAVISFHHLEGEEVEKFFTNHKNLKVVTQQPITPEKEEINNNPSSRSAKLRVAEKIK